MTSILLLIGSVGLFLAGVGLFFVMLDNKLFKNIPAWCLLLVSIIASGAYFLMFLNVGVIEQKGTLIYLIRYIDWMYTTPLLLFVLVSTALKMSWGLVGVYSLIFILNEAMILGGMASRLNYLNLTNLFFVISTVVFVGIVIILTILMRSAKAKGDVFFATYKKLFFVCVLSWSLYPVVFYLRMYHQETITIELSIALFLLLDMFSKGVFGTIYIHDLLVLKQSTEEPIVYQDPKIVT